MIIFSEIANVRPDSRPDLLSMWNPSALAKSLVTLIWAPQSKFCSFPPSQKASSLIKMTVVGSLRIWMYVFCPSFWVQQQFVRKDMLLTSAELHFSFMNESNNPVPFYNNLHFYQQLFKISFSILINFILNLGCNRLERSVSLFIPLGNSLDLLIGSGSFASAFYLYFSNCVSLGETVT